MTREELFRAVGEVREDQIEAAEVTKRQVRPWRRFGALAACLALVVTVAAAPELREADQWKWTAIVKSFNPGAEVSEDPDVQSWGGGFRRRNGGRGPGRLRLLDGQPEPAHPSRLFHRRGDRPAERSGNWR